MSTTKERPILFSGPMVRALLDGTKTQTRRVVKIAVPEDATEVFAWFGGELRNAPNGCAPDGLWCRTPSGLKHLGKCPYGVPGDVLWVREGWMEEWDAETVKPTGRYLYRADGVHAVLMDGDGATVVNKDGTEASPWRPSIHMPRKACRTTLEVVSVRVERLWDISDADVLAEGMTQELCAAILGEAAGRLKPEASYYVRYDDSEFVGHHCYGCCEKEQQKHEGAIIVSENCPETDGPAYCDECHQPLEVSLTAYGIESELFMKGDDGSYTEQFATKGMDAAIAAQFAGGIGDLREHHMPRLLRIGYATLIDQINGEGTWKSNPWVWVVEFRRLP